MNKILEKTLMVMLAALLSLSIASCSNDDDDEPGNDGGNMSGWVEIDGKKYNFSYFYGAKNDNGEISFTGYNKDPYKLGDKDNYNMTSLTLAFKPDGTIDTEDGNPRINYEFEINCNNGNDDADMVMYCNLETSYAGLTAKRSGDKLTIDGKNAEVRYSNPGDGYVGLESPKTTINFHLEGTPKWLDFPEE